MKHFSAVILGAAASAALVSSGFGSIAAPALADAQSTAAIIAGVTAIAGALIFDSSRHQYYYVHGGRHVYVDNNTSNEYFHRHPNMHRDRRDPQYRH